LVGKGDFGLARQRRRRGDERADLGGDRAARLELAVVVLVVFELIASVVQIAIAWHVM
jgi:hypothetical protein